MIAKTYLPGLLLIAPAAALEPLIAHIDIDSQYHTHSQTWTWQLISDGVQKNPWLSYMPGRDLPAGTTSSRTGERHTRPTASAWDFLGVASGQPVWIYTSLDNNYAWLGFADTQSTFTQPLQVRLVGVDGPSGGHFSLYNTSSTVFMRTSDGISSSDLYVRPLSHSHVNWAFSHKGMWRVRLNVRGFLGSGTQNPTSVSQEVPLYFAIGHRAQWRANHFSHETVMNESLAGDMADEDRDGIVNLLEYAFGGSPNTSSMLSTEHGGPLLPRVSMTHATGQSYLEIRYYRRRVGTQPIEATYEAQFANTLEPMSWQTQTLNLSTQTINAQWELVTVRDAQPLSSHPTRFARVKVTAL